MRGVGEALLVSTLTQLSPGLLQLLDLVLQQEHGHCERQQRQKLQLGRHHDSEQPHQTIHTAGVRWGELWSLHARKQPAAIDGAHKAAEWRCMTALAQTVDVRGRSGPALTSNRTCAHVSVCYGQKRVAKPEMFLQSAGFVPPGCGTAGASHCVVAKSCPIRCVHRRTADRLRLSVPASPLDRAGVHHAAPLSIRSFSLLFDPDWTVFY